MEHFFFQNPGENQKKKVFTKKRNKFLPRIQEETCSQLHTRVKLWEGMQM